MLLAALAPTELSPDYLRRRLMVEEGVTESVISILKHLLPESSSLLRSFVPNLETLEKSTAPLLIENKHHLALIKAVKDYSFSTYEDTVVMVPEGFLGAWADYLKALTEQGKIVALNGMKVVNDFNMELSMFLSKADLRTSMKSADLQYRRVKEERLNREAAIKSFYDPKNPTRSRLPLRMIMERFADLEQIFFHAEQLKQVQKSQNFHALADAVKKSADLLTLIKTRLDSDEISAVSGQLAKNISLGAYEVAKYVETAALFGYYTETAFATTHHLTTELSKLFNVKQ